LGIEKDGYRTEDTLSRIVVERLTRKENVRGGITANHAKTIMMEYFLTPIGSIKWQFSKIECNFFK